jgi:hypothetical protein
MPNRFLKMVDNGLLLFKFGGQKEFFHQLRRQIYDRDVQVGLEIQLGENVILNLPECEIKYTLRPASKKDMEVVFQQVKTESNEAVKLLAHRKWLYDCGFHNWYIAQTDDTDEPCFIQSVITAEDNKLVKKHFRNWFPEVKEGEVLLEGAYTFEKFRGKRLVIFTFNDLLKIFIEKGFKRVISYTEKGNIPILKSSERQGFKRFEEVKVLKVLFFTRRKFNRTNGLKEESLNRE